MVTVWRIRVTIYINMNSKLAGTTMGKISFEGVVEQSILFETSKPALFRATTPQKRFNSWLYPQVYYSY